MKNTVTIDLTHHGVEATFQYHEDTKEVTLVRGKFKEASELEFWINKIQEAFSDECGD